MSKAHVPSAQAKVLLHALAQEFLFKLISRADYVARYRVIVDDDRETCRKGCCKRLRLARRAADKHQ